VLYIDIDDFKDVNDTLGHPMGDALLQEIVVRLKQAVREADLVARFGGDEFAILQFNVADHAEVAALATRVVDLMAKPFDVGGHRLHITSSIGVLVFSPGLSGPEAMMMQADVALYDAKDEGRNCFCFHSPRLNQQVHERVMIAEDLRSALDRSELLLYYQPQVDMVSGRITGFEALLRWDHPTRGLLLPDLIHAHRRTYRAGIAARPLGIGRGLPPTQALARSRASAPRRVGECVGGAAQGGLGSRL